MTNSTSLVSIVIPSYNHKNYIKDCIDSIIYQTYSNYELIVIDDGSTDGSQELLHELKLKYSFQLEFQKNAGLSNTLNRGFKEFSKGKYLTFCASDDYWLPEKLQKQVDFMEAHPDYAMVYGKAIIVNSANKILEPETYKANENLKGGYIFKDIFLLSFHPPVNYLIRADVAKELNYYRPDIWAEDFDMNLRISSKYPIGFINEFLSCYRRTGYGKVKMMNYNSVYSHLNSINQFTESPLYKEAIHRWNYRCFLWYCSYKGSKLFALNGMLKSLRYCYKKEFIKAVIIWFLKWE